MAQIKKLQSGGTTPQPTASNSITYKGINFDKNALINSYKDYLKTTAQNNVTGFQQADQYKDIDEHLNKRIGELQGSTVINENSNFTTAPTQVNGITGLNTFLNKDDKSKSQQFENEAFYNFLDKSIELNKQTPSTTSPTNNYHRFNSIIGHITNNDYAGKVEGFNTGWSTATPEAKKSRIKQALVSELTNLKNAGDKEIIGLDSETSAKLRNGDADKYISEIPGATDQRLAEIAGRLGLNTELAELLQATPAETEAKRVDYESKALAATTLHQNNLIQHEKYLATIANNKKITDANLRRRVEADTQNKQFAINKLKRLADAKYKTSGGATITGIGTGPNGEFTTADKLDATALAGDVVSFGGTIPAIVGGLTSTAATLGSDYLRGKSGWEMAGNAAMNVGFTALALIPGLASAKMGVKGIKAAHALKLVDKAAEGAEKTLKVLKTTKVLTEAQRVEKLAALAILKEVDVVKNATKVSKTTPLLSKATLPGTEALSNITSKLPNIITPNVGKIATGIRKVAAVGGLYSGYEGIKDTGSKVLSGNAKDINLNDARNLLYGAMAVKGINRRIQKGAA